MKVFHCFKSDFFSGEVDHAEGHHGVEVLCSGVLCGDPNHPEGLLGHKTSVVGIVLGDPHSAPQRDFAVDQEEESGITGIC